MGSWFNFKATTTQRVNAVLKVVVKTMFIKMTQNMAIVKMSEQLEYIGATNSTHRNSDIFEIL